MLWDQQDVKTRLPPSAWLTFSSFQRQDFRLLDRRRNKQPCLCPDSMGISYTNSIRWSMRSLTDRKDNLVTIKDNTYPDASSEDIREPWHIGCQRMLKKHFSLNPGISHRVKDCNTNPEPDVEGCKHTAEIATALQAFTACTYCHWSSLIINLIY